MLLKKRQGKLAFNILDLLYKDLNILGHKIIHNFDSLPELLSNNANKQLNMNN